MPKTAKKPAKPRRTRSCLMVQYTPEFALSLDRLVRAWSARDGREWSKAEVIRALTWEAARNISENP